MVSIALRLPSSTAATAAPSSGVISPPATASAIRPSAGTMSAAAVTWRQVEVDCSRLPGGPCAAQDHLGGALVASLRQLDLLLQDGLGLAVREGVEDQRRAVSRARWPARTAWMTRLETATARFLTIFRWTVLCSRSDLPRQAYRAVSRQRGAAPEMANVGAGGDDGAADVRNGLNGVTTVNAEDQAAVRRVVVRLGMPDADQFEGVPATDQRRLDHVTLDEAFKAIRGLKPPLHSEAGQITAPQGIHPLVRR